MITAAGTTAIAENLKQKVKTDLQFDATESIQIVHMVDLLVNFLKPHPDIPKKSRKDVPKDAGYGKHISALWYNVANNMQLEPSTKRSALYAIQELQHILWQK